MNLNSARIWLGLFILLGVSACEEGFGTNLSTEAQPQETGEARVEVREVERPDIFSASESGLWDGRPSLGGVWVAHPDVTTPESVLITNTANDRTIPGALFRRERSNPGPRIQVSSDAASQLGMLAGQPVELKIIVVRREEVVIEPDPLPISDETAETDESAGTEESDGAGAAVAGAAATADKPKKPGFWQRFKQSLQNEPDSETAGSENLEAETTSASAPKVETAPLDPVATSASAAIAEAEAEETQPDPAPERSAEAGALKNPFVQVGLFGVEANASAAAANLRQAGVVPTVKQITNSEGKTLWRVLIGPLTSADDQAEILALVKKLGYRDAFLSPN